MPTDDQLASLRTTIAGVSIVEMAEQFGTPTYVYDASLITQRIADLSAFDIVRYAQKACSNLAILDLVRRQRAMIDSVSAGEIRRALAAGYPVEGDPPPIVYTADIFDAEALDLVDEHNIHVNCGSIDMIAQLGAHCPGREITLRINPGFGHGHSQKTNTGGPQSKHGIWHEQLGDALLRADQFDLTVSGLHMHIGSGTDIAHLSKVCNAMEEAATVAGRSLKSISAGGGLPIAYEPTDAPIDLDAYFRLWDATRKRLEAKLGHALSLEIEPGRYIAAESGYVVCEICAVKQMGENLFYLVDAGFNTLARPILYGSYHPMSIVPVADQEDRSLVDAVVGGPLCESGDIFTQEEGGIVCSRRLPQAYVGDLLVIECAGAYGAVMASNYNSRSLPAEVLVDDGQPRLIRARQSFEQMIADEVRGIE